MSNHTKRGTRITLWVDDGFGNLTRIGIHQLSARIMSGWGEL
jgi:hypothetical protein